MTVSVQIAFDRPHAAYLAGERVGGAVVVRADKPMRLRAISVTFRGEASTHWSERKSFGSEYRDVKLKDDETYFDDTGYIVGGSSGEQTLPPGEHRFPFGFLLPAALPSSLEGHKEGCVRYTARATLHRPWRFDHGAKAAFSVAALVDLNALPQIQQPVAVQEGITLPSLLCKSRSLTMVVRLPVWGYVPGGVIPVQVELRNDTKTDVSNVSVCLNKEVEWRVRGSWWSGKSKRATCDTVVRLDLGGSPARSCGSLARPLHVPAVPPSSVGRHSKIVDLQYALAVRAELPATFGSRKVRARVPLVIGTVPLVPLQPGPAPTTPSAPPRRPPPSASTSSPSSPPTDSPESPPPRYEECFFSKSSDIMDGADDDEYTMGARAFAPRYPVYDLPPAHAK